MRTKNKSITQIVEQLDEHGIEFGVKYRDPASGFEGEVQSMYFYRHGCLRVELRGSNRTTGEPASFVFDAPDLVKVETNVPVPAGRRTGGPHDMAVAPR
jgi:hypothetical protein